MKASAPARVYGFAPKLLPPIVTLLLAILSAVPIDFPDYAAVTPNFVLMSLFHWTLYRPEYLSYVAVFLIGLFFDLLTTAPGTTVGLTPLVLLLARLAVLASRRSFVGRSFPFVWFGFALLTAATDLVVWAVGSLLSFTVMDPRSLAFQAVLTVALFPMATWLFARLQRVTEAA